jgi:hypothetical protein
LLQHGKIVKQMPSSVPSGTPVLKMSCTDIYHVIDTYKGGAEKHGDMNSKIFKYELVQRQAKKTAPILYFRQT